MGAGRSGTTALATFLGNSSNILTIGEMHQFFQHLAEHKECSCGKSLEECPLWFKVIENLPKDFRTKAQEHEEFCEKFEYHSSIPKYMFNTFTKDNLEKYHYINETIFNAIKMEHKEKFLLDSAKYIGRALGLRSSKNIDLKIIYVVRDVRGVINSFAKGVQTPRGAMSSIVYWLIINTIAEFVYRTSSKKNIIKLKYESLIDTPLEEFQRLEKFLDLDMSDIKDKIKEDKDFSMPHIIGGNRMKTNKSIKFQKDIAWRDKQSIVQKILYYIFASPIMLLNRFKI
jgi:hypothetical protein